MAATDWLTTLTPFGAGLGGLGIGIYSIAEWVDRHRHGGPRHRVRPDSETANAILMSALHERDAALEAERVEGERKDKRIAYLEDRNSELHQQGIDQRQKFDKQLRAMEVQINGLTDQVSQLRRELTIEQERSDSETG